MPDITIIKQVSCGFDHSLILSEEGKVFSFGKNNQGQLGFQKS